MNDSSSYAGILIPIAIGLVLLALLPIFFSVAILCDTPTLKIADWLGVVDCSLVVGDSGSGLVSAGQTEWKMPKPVLDKIIQKKQQYMEVANKYKMPWQILAAVNYRECGLRDCGPSGEVMGSVNPDSGKVECPVSSGYSECLGKVAKHLRSLSSGVYDVTLSQSSPENDIKLALLSYNRGYMYKNEGCEVGDSPYVMNQFDSSHKNMRWPNNSCEPSSTRGRVNVPAGGFTVYSYLVNNGI